MRYMMKDSTKDTVLQRDNRFNKGPGCARWLDLRQADRGRDECPGHGSAQGGVRQREGDHAGGVREYRPKSTNAQDRETWAMLPEETKAEVRRIWGKDGLFVHHNARDIVFGYRKLSLADAIRNTEMRRGWAELGLPVPKGGWDDQLEHALSHAFTVVMGAFLRQSGLQ